MKKNKTQSVKKQRKQRKQKSDVTEMTGITGIYNHLRLNLESLNNSKYFTGAMLIMLNLGTKYVSLDLTKAQEKYLKYAVSRQLLLFTILWVGTRDIVISLILTAVFIILANYLFNENSKYCIIPEKYKDLYLEIDKNGDGIISEKEIDDALDILKKAKNKKNQNESIKNEELIRENFI